MMQTCIRDRGLWWHSMAYRSIGLASGATCNSFKFCALASNGHSIVFMPICEALSGHRTVAMLEHDLPIHDCSREAKPG